MMFPNRVSYVDLVELNMLDFDVIFRMNWLHACFASTDCRAIVVRFNFQNESFLELMGVNSNPRGRIISCLKTCNMISNCVYIT